MFIISNFIIAVARVLDILLNLFLWAIIIRAVISWVNPDPFNPIVQFLNRITEPVLRPVRRIIPPIGIGIDLSPFFAMLIIIFAQSFIVQSLFHLAQSIR